jgi:hypothetical protein
MVCDGDAGTQTRTCSDVCQWGDFGDCTGDECEDNEEQECYEGPMGTQGVGVCRVGRQFCANGRFGACQGQISPGPEQCTDGRDNDCDGSSDGADEDCVQEGAEIGSACEQDGECVGELICLQSPQHPEFTGGYCGKDECASAQDCGVDGVCGQFDGQSYCLRLCQSGSDCRRGYRCGNVGAVGNACVPGCNSDADCTDSVLSVCDTNTNQCVEAMDPTPDPTPSPTPDMQPDMTPTPSPTMQPPNNDNFVGDPAPVAGADDGGCCTIPPARPTRTPWAPIALVIVLGLAAAIRRR